MNKVSNTLEFGAKMLLRLCKEKGLASCAVATSMKSSEKVYSFCEALRDEMQKSGKRVLVAKAGQTEGEKQQSGDLLLVFAPQPELQMDSFRACSDCDATLLVEEYGVTSHRALDDLTEFLRNLNIDILGVIALKK